MVLLYPARQFSTMGKPVAVNNSACDDMKAAYQGCQSNLPVGTKFPRRQANGAVVTLLTEYLRNAFACDIVKFVCDLFHRADIFKRPSGVLKYTAFPAYSGQLL